MKSHDSFALAVAIALAVALLSSPGAPGEPAPGEGVTRIGVTNRVFVETFAGSGSPGYRDGNGRNSSFRVPNGPCVFFGSQHIYLADTENHRIRFLNSLGLVTNLAGSGIDGFADGPAYSARFSYPLGVCVDAAGNAYVADAGNNRIRRIASGGTPYGGTVTTVAGTGVGGYGDGGKATARLNFPNDLVMDEAGVLFVTEFDNHTVRRITPDGTVSTWVGNGQPGIANGPRTSARLMQPAGIARDSGGNLFITEYGGQRVRKVDASGMVSTLAGDGTEGYVDGPGAQARFRNPDGIVAAPDGYLYLTDKDNHAIRRISPSGFVETVAGVGSQGTNDGPGNLAAFAQPSGISRGDNGFFYVTDGANHLVRRIILDPEPATITQSPASQTVPAWSEVVLAVTATGTAPITYQWQHQGTNLPGASQPTLAFQSRPALAGEYSVVCRNFLGAVTSSVATLTITLPAQYLTNLVAVSTLAGSGLPGSVDGTGPTARFNSPNGGAVDAGGSIYVADTAGHRIRVVRPDGTVATLAGSGVPGYADGLAPSSRFQAPLGVAVDRDGNVYVADSGNQRIRKISTSGAVTTLAGSGVTGYRDGPANEAWFSNPNDLVIDDLGNLFITEFGNHTVRRLSPAGIVSTWIGNGTPGYADGLWSGARLTQPGGIAIDRDGNLLVTEYGGQRLRRIAVSGTVTTLAGDGLAGYRDGPATQARFRNPDGLVVDARGYVYIADNGNHAIRRFSPAGLVETVAGWGDPGRADGTGEEARFFNPTGLGIDAQGTLFVTDGQNNQVRRVALEPSQILVIVSQPQSQTVAVGGTVAFSLAAQGTAPIGITWFKDGDPVPGALGTSLVLSDVRLTAAGNYWAVVTNRFAAVTTATATLTVRQPIEPVLGTAFGHFYARVESPGITWSQARSAAEQLTWLDLPGHLASLTSAAENSFVSSDPALGGGTEDRLNRCWIGAYQPPEATEPEGDWRWITGEPLDYRNWSPLEPNDANPGEDVALLNHALDAEGKQWNDAPDNYGSALGFVVEFEPAPDDTRPPRLLRQPQNQVIPAGRSLVLRVEAVSSSPPVYAWAREGLPIAGATEATLTIPAAGISDSGRYQVIVSDNHGSVTSRVAVVSVTGTGPGSVNFATRSTGIVDARVMVQGTETTPADGRFVAQLYAGPPGGTLEAAGAPVAFAETPPAALGYIVGGGTVELPGVGPGQPAMVKMVAWLRGYGATYEEARRIGCYWGESAPVTLVAGGGLLPPASLVGLQGFAIATGAGCSPLPPPVGAVPVAGPPSGHWYQRIDAPLVSWSLARNLAEGMTYRGRTGHLVAITSAEENLFLTSHPQLGNGTADALQGCWIGALRPADAGLPANAWRWVTSESFAFANWHAGQTNESPGTESHAVFLGEISGNGKEWALGTEFGPASGATGYVVEYEGGEPPQLTDQPASRTIAVGETALLSAAARGTTPLSYQWFFNEARLAGPDSIQPVLVLTNIQLHQSGTYWAVVSNPIDTVTSQVATITVVPAFTWLTNVTVSRSPATGLLQPFLGATDEEGSGYFADAFDGRIRRLTYDDQLTTLAGAGGRGFLDGPALTAQFDGPRGLARDSRGRIYVADTENHRLRRITPEGQVSTFAGSGEPGLADGTALTARFQRPMRVVVGPDDTLYLTDYGNHAVRRIAADGTVSTVAGTGQPGYQDGPPATARFQNPTGIALHPNGDLFVTEAGVAHRIRRISSAGEVTTFAGTEAPGFRDGTLAEARFRDPVGLAFGNSGQLYVADSGNHAVRRISADGVVLTVAGDGTPGSDDGSNTVARLSRPSTIVVDPLGTLWVGDLGYPAIRRIQIGKLVGVPPTITRQPVSLVGFEGDPATFDVAATGTPPLRYRWHKYASPITGATNTTLALPSLQFGDAGEYTVLVENRFGFAKSKIVTLQVLPPTSPTLVNGDFEEPRLTPGVADWKILHQSEVPGWSTTAADRVLKLWSDDPATPPYSGAQYGELQVYGAAAWYQDITGLLPGAQLGYEFAHRGRNGSESLELVITDLGSDGQPGGAADTVLFRKSFASGPASWVRYDSQSDPPILALGNLVRVAFETRLSGASGNLIDAVRFGPGVGGAVPSNSPPVILVEPADVELAVGESTLLTVTATGGTPLGYRWTRDNGPLPAGNPWTRSLALTNVQVADGGRYSVTVTNPYGSTVSRPATVFVSPVPRPKLTSAVTRGDPYHVRATFSTALDPASAERADNYRISDGGTVIAAALEQADTVLLETLLPRPGWYQLSVEGVRAAGEGGLPVAPGASAAFALTDGRVSWAIYDRIEPGTSLDSFLQGPRYLNSWTSRSGLCPSFEFPTDDQGSLLVGQLRAYLFPPVTGPYRFVLWNDDVGRLYLGTNDQPRAKRLIARLDRAVPFRAYAVTSAPVQLQSGRRYYVEAVYLENDEADGIGVAWMPPGAAAPVPGDPPISGEFLSSFNVPGAPSLARNPATIPTRIGDPLTLQLGPLEIGGSPPYAYQWLWNGAPLPGATNPQVTIPWIGPDDSNARVGLRVTNYYGVVERDLAIVAPFPDKLPPRVTWVEPSLEGMAVLVRFSEAVALPSATDLANYSLTGGASITSASRQADGRTVRLETSALVAGQTYELAVRNLADLEGNQLPAEQRLAFPARQELPGQLARETWRGPGIGRHLGTLISLPTFQSEQPARRQVQRGAESATNAEDHYAQRLWGWLVPPVTGEYRFAIAADESGALYLGPDERREDLPLVAYTTERTEPREWTKSPSQLTAPRLLVAGQAYAFEAVATEGTGPDHLSLAWIPPGADTPRLIDESALLLRLDPRQLGPIITSHPGSLTTYQQVGGSLQVEALPGAYSVAPLRYQWQRNGLDLPGASNAVLHLPVPLDPTGDQAALYRCLVTDGGGAQIITTEAALTVLPQAQPARLRVAIVGGQLRITWPAESGVRLQQATRLNFPDWEDVPGTEGIGQADVPAAWLSRYYRLVRPPQ